MQKEKKKTKLSRSQDVGHKDDLILKVSDKVPSFRTSAAEAPVLHKCKEDFLVWGLGFRGSVL